MNWLSEKNIYGQDFRGTHSIGHRNPCLWRFIFYHPIWTYKCIKAAEMVQWVKAPQPSLIIRVWSLRPRWWKERTNPRMFSQFHVRVFTCVYPRTYIQKYILFELKSKYVHDKSSRIQIFTMGSSVTRSPQYFLLNKENVDILEHLGGWGRRISNKG